MKLFPYSSFIPLIFFFAAISYADFTGKGHVHTLSESKQVFLNPDCRSTNSCDLKRFTLTKAVNEIWFSDNADHPTYSNGVIMEYETDSVAALEKYAIVQFKKGCVFDAYQNRDGEVRRDITYTVTSFGEQIPFCFRRWVIDSQDRDPAYNSDPDFGRFYLLRWNEPGSYDKRTQKYYGAEKPIKPIVYMADYPAGAFITRTGVRNVALEFKSCIYKAGDVPTQTSRNNLEFGKPLSCFDWQNVYVYDFAKARFETDLAALPTWEEPPVAAKKHRSLIGVAVLIAIMLIGLLRLWKLHRRRISSDS
ncbi:MAG TPA: hypothetical protein VFQ89_03775 [Candidatus Binatia bacterium]|nr:hypothetical protein [Candidatus Binatia bacterium]